MSRNKEDVLVAFQRTFYHQTVLVEHKHPCGISRVCVRWTDVGGRAAGCWGRLVQGTAEGQSIAGGEIKVLGIHHDGRRQESQAGRQGEAKPLYY